MVIKIKYPTDEEEVRGFLLRYEDFSMFLLGNLAHYGLKMGSAPYSGDYQLIYEGDHLIGVFCLTRAGSLLIQCEKPVNELILELNLPIKGLVGEWMFCKGLWDFLKSKGVIQKERFVSKEALYALNSQSYRKSEARQLLPEEFERWSLLNEAFHSEMKLPSPMTKKQVQEEFLYKVKEGIIWGNFYSGKMVSVAELNARAEGFGQVGGVYTDPAHRGQGHARGVMEKLCSDCYGCGIHKLIIFTGENNLAARALYESMGGVMKGHFALLF